jgi:hypothetical protein
VVCALCLPLTLRVWLRGLAGAIPTQIGQLLALKSDLILETNHLSGEYVKRQWCGCPAIFTLPCVCLASGVEGSIPTEIGQLTALTTELSLSTNSLTGEHVGGRQWCWPLSCLTHAACLTSGSRDDPDGVRPAHRAHIWRVRSYEHSDR